MMQALRQHRKAAIVGGLGTFTVAIGVGLLYPYFTDNPKCCKCNHPVMLNDQERQSTFNKNAPFYDYLIEKEEFFTGITLFRYWQISRAAGSVLELGCGTGRNFSFYKKQKVDKVVGLDFSESMLIQAEKKIKESKDSLNIFARVDVPVELKQQDCHNLVDYKDDEFTTVVDSFGLCSYHDPIRVLKEMARVCNKENGKILLLEHGLGSYNFINNIINRSAQNHAKQWGCIYNLDISKLVEDAGLEIVSVSRWNFGTTYVIEARPRKVARVN